jgi:Arc/MetJ-type ribon-helix-helix transcriptional regulator
MENKVTIKIPRPLYEKIQVLVADSGFSSPTEFIVYILRDLVGEQMGGKTTAKEAGELTGDEIAAIKQRLRNLGYL